MANRNDESRQNLKVVKEDILRRERFLGERDVGARQQWNRLAGGAKDSFVVYENYKTVYKGKNAQKVKYHGPVQQKRGKPPVPHGVGTMTYTNGYVLRGPFKAGRRHGTFSVTTSMIKIKFRRASGRMCTNHPHHAKKYRPQARDDGKSSITPNRSTTVRTTTVLLRRTGRSRKKGPCTLPTASRKPSTTSIAFGVHSVS